MCSAGKQCFMLCCVALTVAWSSPSAAAPATVVDVPTRGVVQRFLYIRPDAPVANIVFLPGLDGIFGIQGDGTMPTIAGRCAPFARNRDAFAARGFAVALVDQASDFKIRNQEDIREVVRYMRNRDSVPTWIVGGSASTTAALSIAVALPPDELLGVIIFSPARPDLAKASLVKRPVLIVYHRDDTQSQPVVDPLYEALTSTSAKERTALAGGSNDGCGYHLFAGIDAEFVAAVARFIDKHGTPRGQPREGPR